MDKRNKLSVKKALIWIVASTFLISGTTGIGLLYYFHIQELHGLDERFHVVSIVQDGPLSSDFFAEALSLSIDRPTNLFQFDCEKAKHKLLTYPWIRQAIVKKVMPATLEIRYSIHQPIARLGDLTNTLMSDTGILFPEKPFYSLPEDFLTLYVGDLEQATYLPVAIDIIEKLSNKNVKMIDLSKMEAPSLGQREIVVLIRDSKEWIARLNPKDYTNQLENLEKVQNASLPRIDESMITIVDLRIPHLAFIR